MIPVLTTGRLTLRPPVAGDAPNIASALNQWSVTRWLTLVPYPYGIADAVEFLDGLKSHLDGAFWAIDAGEGMIGAISVKPDLGYWLAPEHHGRGYMTEAARAVIAWYFTHHDEPLISGYHVGNHASRGVLRKLGFQETHRERAYQVATDETVQIQRMALSPADWRLRS